MWIPVDAGNTLGQTGSEKGVILKDEEYKDSCRVTLEKCPEYYAITCGIYGLMCHTTFGGEDLYEKYEKMKRDLQEFLDQDTVSDEEAGAFCECFVDKY